MNNNIEEILKKLDSIEECLVHLTEHLKSLDLKIKELESKSPDVRY